MISSGLDVSWRPRPFLHMEVPAMACNSQPVGSLSQDCTSFRPISKPPEAEYGDNLGGSDTQFREEPTEAEIARLGSRLEDFFTRRPGPFGSRSPWRSAKHMIAAMFDGGIAMRLCRVPAEHVAEALSQCPDDHLRETAEHRQMKRACLLWMRSLGGHDAVEEAPYSAGIADAMSDSLNWVVECGHTGIHKPQALALADATTRFTLVPFQDMRRFNGRPRSLVAVDFVWTLEAAAHATKAHDAAMHRAAEALCFGHLPKEDARPLPLAQEA